MKRFFDYIVYGFAGIGFILVSGFFAVKFGITNERGIIDNQRNSFTKTPYKELEKTDKLTKKTKPLFATTEEWKVLKEAILRDKEPIYKASAVLGVQPRIIVSILIVEQMRLYSDNREVFKTVFAPLKILGVQSQFSWGVAGIKQETAIQIENSLLSSSSPFYPGKEYEHVLDFKTENQDEERFVRLTDEHDRYYSYLYTATFIKEIGAQWKKAGYPIDTRPEILSTLFNIGFSHSKPNKDPKSGGALITVGDIPYSFGSLASEFYYSDELTDYFPR